MDRATTIRMPSTANLMVDSADRNTSIYSSPWDFAIQKNQSIQNGFFTRIGVTEVTLEWCNPNISSDLSNNIFRLDISGTNANNFSVQDLPITLTSGNCTVAEAVENIVEVLNLLTGTTGTTFTIQSNFGVPYIDVSGAVVTVSTTSSTLNSQLGLSALEQDVIRFIYCPDLQIYRYLDFVSSQLTYAQDLKDNSTSNINRDVLVRWYMADDVPEQLDSLGFPILMGYKNFKRRRIFNPPKQIKWDNNLPIGNLTFQVYDESGDIINDPGSLRSNFLMTLQLSEN